jgi:hypothetical protein
MAGEAAAAAGAAARADATLKLVFCTAMAAW